MGSQESIDSRLAVVETTLNSLGENHKQIIKAIEGLGAKIDARNTELSEIKTELKYFQRDVEKDFEEVRRTLRTIEAEQERNRPLAAKVDALASEVATFAVVQQRHSKIFDKFGGGWWVIAKAGAAIAVVLGLVLALYKAIKLQTP